MLNNEGNMVIITYSTSTAKRLVKRISAIVLVSVGFFAIFFASTPRVPGSGGSSSGLPIAEVAHADAPACSDCASCSTSSCGDSSSGGCGCGGCSCDSGGGGGGGGGDGGGSFICTELYRQGRLSVAWYEADGRFAQLIPDDVRVGYQLWARPLALSMQKSHFVTRLVEVFARPWAQQMAYEMGVAESGSRLGNILMVTGIPVCRALGRVAISYGRNLVGPAYIG